MPADQQVAQSTQPNQRQRAFLSNMRSSFAQQGRAMAQPQQVGQADQVQQQTDKQVTSEQPVQSQSQPVFDQSVSLAVADQIISDIEQQRSQAAQMQAASSGGREQEPSGTIDSAAVEAAANIQYVEQEPNPELPPEVEGYLQHVEDHTGQAPQEIVISDHQTQPLPSHVPKQSVVVLPVDQNTEKQGAKKSPTFSIRWLVEWSRKLMKMFKGKVVYREVE